jgi:hypothetical protein
MVAHRHAAGHLDVDQLVGGAAVLEQGGDELAAALQPLLAAVRVVDPQLGEAAAEPDEVLVEAEQLLLVDRHHLVDAVAENEAAVEHRDLRFGERQVFAVEVAEGVRDVHGSPLTPILT